MKNISLITGTIAFLLLLSSCEKHEVSTKHFTVNINGKDYTYITKTAMNYTDRETGLGDMQIMGQNSEYGDFSHCVVNIEYKLLGDGTYTMTDLKTLMKNVENKSSNKYVHVHVNLGPDYKENIAKYRISGNSDLTMEATEKGRDYIFTIFESIPLNKTSYLGTPPISAPGSIKLSISSAHL